MAIPIDAADVDLLQEVTQLAFQRGHAGRSACRRPRAARLDYALGLWPAFVSLLLNRTLSAGNHQRGILWTTVVTVAITIGLDLILLGPMEQSGLALASTIGVYLNAADADRALRHHFAALSLLEFARRQGRVLAAGLIAAAVALLSDVVLPRAATGLPRGAAAPGREARARPAAFIVASRVLAPVELAEAGRALRAVFLRRPRPRLS